MRSKIIASLVAKLILPEPSVDEEERQHKD